MPENVVQTADIHQHLIPPVFIEMLREDKGRHEFVLRQNSDGQEEIEVPDGGIVGRLVGPRVDAATRRKDMVAAGIDVAVQSVLPTLMSYGGTNRDNAAWGARAMNDALAENMRAEPDHVVAMGTVPLQFPDLALAELERVTEELSMPSIQLSSHVHGETLEAKELRPFWDAVQSNGVLIFIHPGDVDTSSRLGNYYLGNLVGNPLETVVGGAGLIFGGVLHEFPRLKIVLAHGGGYLPYGKGRLRHGSKVRKEPYAHGYEGNFEDDFGKLYFDTLTHDAEALSFLIKLAGPDRVVHGTDYVADMSDWHQVDTIRSMSDVADHDKAKVLGGNILDLIGWKAS